MALSIAPATNSKYTSYFRTYYVFCGTLSIPPFPISENTLILFATHLCPTHSHKVISAHISAIQFTAQLQGYSHQAPLDRLYRLIRGIKRTQGKKFNKPPRIPITPPLLTRMGHTLWNSSENFQDKIMLWAAFLVAFHGFLRVSEYTSSHIHKYNNLTTLCFTDVHINNPSSISLHIKASKTDPFRQGANIHLFINYSPLCPVRALLSYISSHPTWSGPLFQWHDGRYLTRSGLASAMQRIKPQHISNMSSHSFRIGAATTAAAAGYPRWLIQALGRWTSNCYKDYIRIPTNTLQRVSHSLCQNQPIPSLPFDPDNVSW